MSHVLLNGQLVAEQDARIPVTDRGFRYGDGVFETLRICHGIPLHYDWHHKRLQAGLDAILLNYDTAGLATLCRQLIEKNNCTEGLLRIQISRGSSGRGYLPDDGTPTCVIETLPLPPAQDAPVSLWLSDYRRIPDNALPVQSKLCQGLNPTLTRLEAHKNDCFDGLQLNQQGMVCETSSANIFWRKQQTLFTPALDCGVLEGSVRHIICQRAENLHTLHAGLDKLESADAVCITNVAWGAVPVASLQPAGMTWDSTALAAELNQLLSQDRQEQIAAHGK